MSDVICDENQRRGRSLKELSFHAVREHFAVVGTEALLDLPTALIEDLLPHLTVCQLNELQPVLNQRGISTFPGWIGVLLDMCGPRHVIDLRTEEEAKYKVMKKLFSAVFYGFKNCFIKRNLSNLNTTSFLQAAVTYLRQFSLLSVHKPLQTLTAEQRPFMNLLEECIDSVVVSHCVTLSKKETQTILYVLHRLLDHGVAKELIVHAQCPIILAWLLHERGTQYTNSQLKNLTHSKSCDSQTISTNVHSSSQHPVLKTRALEDRNEPVIPYKHPKLDSVLKKVSENANFTVDPHNLCQMFCPSDGMSAGACPYGQINRLEISQCSSDCLGVLNAALPTFYCLHSLTLQSFSTFTNTDVMELAQKLRQLSESSYSSLTELNISILPCPELMVILMEASPYITSMHMEIQTVWGYWNLPPHYNQTDKSDLPLEKLTLKIAGFKTEVDFITSVLQRSPHLISLHVAGMRLQTVSCQSKLFTTLSDSNHLLRSLTLEDMKLSDCLPQILSLLSDCRLEELHLNDCRLLETWTDKEACLLQLVSALKSLSSLHTLSLAQNRLAKNVCVLVELFNNCSPSSVKKLNVSSNFIQPAELLEFAKRLKSHRPPYKLILDLRKNPGDRDPNTWCAALKILCSFCDVLVEGWISTNTMADHISNM